MKILLTTDPEIPVPPNIYGGAERVAHNLLIGLTREGHEMVLLAHPDSSDLIAEKVIPWCRLSSVGKRNIFKNAFQLLSVIKEEKPDCVICFSRVLYLYPSWLFTRLKFIKRYGRYISPKSNALANFLIGRRIHYTPNAWHMIDHLPKKKKYTPIYSGVDTDYYCENDKYDKEFYLFLGRIEHIKGTREAVQACISAKKDLIIAGNVPDEHLDYFQSFIEPYVKSRQVKYIGPVDDQQKKDLLQRSIALLQPFNLNSEAFPSTVIESLACGTPVIGFMIPTLIEAIQDGKNGFIVSDVDGMTSAMSKVGALSREFIREDAIARFSISKTTSDYLQLIKNYYG